MKGIDKKAARAVYKERKTVAGIYAVRCVPSAEVWVGQSLNLDTVQNRIWFGLKSGNTSRAALQRAWTAHGADSISFEKLESLEDEALPMSATPGLGTIRRSGWRRLARWRFEAV